MSEQRRQVAGSGVEAGILIIGASQAGLQVAVSLRELGHEGPVTLLGNEAHAPYQRPPLSKAFLTGEMDAEGLAFRTPSFYAEAGIDLIRGEHVCEISLAADHPGGAPGSGTARTESGLTLAFDRLALAVGARPRRLTVPGADLDGVSYLRDLDDAAQLRSRLQRAEHVVVVGGGFIGLEAAAVARTRARTVTVVEAADRLISRAVAPVVSEFYRQAHQRRGTGVLLSVGVSRFAGDDGRVSEVHLTDGTVLPADLVLVGVGVEPHTELAQQLGLEVDGGIVVDAEARTSNPSIVAAGDCTVLPHPMDGPGRVRLESVQSAVAQARVAAATLVGRIDGPRAPRNVPWFWSDQGDLKLQIAGLSSGYDDIVVRGEPDEEQFSVLYYLDGRLVAVDAINKPTDYMVVRKALAQGWTIPPALAADPDVPLKKLMAPADHAALPR